MLLGYIWLLGTFVNSSCDIKINVNIVQNCCRNLAVRGLKKCDHKVYENLLPVCASKQGNVIGLVSVYM